MWLVWTGGNDRFWDQLTQYTFGAFDLLKIVTSHPSQTYCDGKRCDRDSRWTWLGVVNEPCFEKPASARPEALRPVARRAQRGLRGRSVRGRDEVPGRGDRRARQDARGRHDAAGRLLLRLRDRHSRPAPVPQSGLRRGGEGRGTRSATTPTRATTTTRSWFAPTGSACPAASAMSARARSIRRPTRRIRNGRTSARRSARNTCGWTGCSSSARADTKNFMYQLVHSYPPGHDGHLAGLDRQHQQSAHHERGLRASCRAWG